MAADGLDAKVACAVATSELPDVEDGGIAIGGVAWPCFLARRPSSPHEADARLVLLLEFRRSDMGEGVAALSEGEALTLPLGVVELAEVVVVVAASGNGVNDGDGGYGRESSVEMCLTLAACCEYN